MKNILFIIMALGGFVAVGSIIAGILFAIFGLTKIALWLFAAGAIGGALATLVGAK